MSQAALLFPRGGDGDTTSLAAPGSFKLLGEDCAASDSFCTFKGKQFIDLMGPRCKCVLRILILTSFSYFLTSMNMIIKDFESS